jgi:preprotein translocase subunit SecA
MTVSFNLFQNRYESYLTTKQKNIFQCLPKHFQSIFIKRFSHSKDVDDINTAKSILNIMKFEIDKDLENTRDLFFEVLVKSRNREINQYLEKLLAVFQKELTPLFFGCISTHQEQYYSAETLFSIIEAFYGISESFKQPYPPLTYFPPYDQEGKEILSKITENPSNIAKLLSKTESLVEFFINSSKKNNFDVSRDQILNQFSDFISLKSVAISYLASLSEENRLSMRTYILFFKFLQEEDVNIKLSSLDKCKIISVILQKTSDEKKTIENRYSIDDLKEILCEAHRIQEEEGEDHLVTFCLSLNSFKESSLSDEEDLDSILKRFAGQDANVKFPLDEKSLKNIKDHYLIIQKYCKEGQNLRTSTLVNRVVDIKVKAHLGPLKIDDILDLIAIGRLAIRNELNVYLYTSQVLTVLGLLLSHPKCIAQVKTGEGKSLIVTLLAFVLAMQGKQIHIISSSPELSKRDQKDVEEFFRLFEVSTSHICDQRYTQAKYFQNCIVYGTSTDYMFAIMVEMTECMKIFPESQMLSNEEERFDCVIIDEVDNLTIDTALNGARMAQPAESSYEWVYEPILRFVKTYSSKTTDDKQIVNDLKKYLETMQDGKFFDLANQLKDDQLATWVLSASRALFSHKEKESYVIDLVKRGNQENGKGVVIIDANNTGRKMHGMRWSNGLHEFVEVKHGLDVQRESLTLLSLSNAVFYRMYKSIFALTGTLGGEIEREELKEIYQINSFDVPTYKPSKRIDRDPIIFSSEKVYKMSIIKKIKDRKKKGQPILVLCKTIADTERIADWLSDDKIPFAMLNELQDESDEVVIEKAGLPGAITIATNTAGRGTDIKLSKTSLENGGLCVLMTFYPISKRVEDQARGRAGRQGQAGESEIIVLASDLSLPLSLSDDIQNISEQQMIKTFLIKKREQQAQVSKSVHSLRANLERCVFSFVKKFFNDYKLFKESFSNELFLRNISTSLNSRKLLVIKVDNLKDLHSKDRKIAEVAFKLFTSDGEEISQWKELLRSIGGRISIQVLNDFAIKFFQQYEQIVMNSNLDSHVNRLNNIKISHKILSEKFNNDDEFLLFKKIEEEELLCIKKKELKVKEEIKNIFLNWNSSWEKRLHPSGSGILAYLREITQLSLKHLEE